MTVYLNGGAQAVEFWHMHIAIFKDIFDKGAGTVSEAGNRHDLRLHIGWKTWMWLGTNVDW